LLYKIRKDFWYGAKHQLTAYVDSLTYWNCVKLSAVVVLALPLGISGVENVILCSDDTKVVSILNGMVNVLTGSAIFTRYLRTPLRVLRYVVEAPFMKRIHRSAITGKIDIGSPTVQFIRKERRWMQVATRWNTIHNIFIGAVCAPIFEEIQDRFLFYVFWKGTATVFQNVRNMIKGETYMSESDEQNQLWFGYSRWVVVSSICFGLDHVGNYFPFRSNCIKQIYRMLQEKDLHLPPDKMTCVLVQAVCHFFAASTAAGLSLGSIFESRGLAACIADHAAWNVVGPHCVIVHR
jgi:hypothetical protein